MTRSALGTTLALVLLSALAAACGDDPVKRASVPSGSDPDPSVDATSSPPVTDAGTPSTADPGPPPPPPDIVGDAGPTAAEDVSPPADTPPPCGCDDGDPCTSDECAAEGGCIHEPQKAPGCAPTVVIQSPPRATTMYDPAELAVAGTHSAPAGLDALTLNSGPLTAQGPPWATELKTEHGLNILRAEVVDLAGASDRAVHGAIVGQAFYPVTQGDDPSAGVNNGLIVYLGEEVWDDDDMSDADDIATIVANVIDGIDLSSLLSQTLFAEGEGPGLLWCQWAVAINDIEFEVASLDLTPVPGGLALVAVLKDFLIDFAATDSTFLCVDAVGTAKSAEIQIEAVMWISLDDQGALSVVADEVKVEIAPPTIDFTTGFLSLFDWFVNWFKGPLSTLIENQVEAALVDQVGPLIAQVLDSFATDGFEFEIPSIMNVTQPTVVTLGVIPKYVAFDSFGATMALSVRVTAPKPAALDISSLGSLARNGCLHGNPKAFIVPTSSPMVLAAHDDLLNQVLFAAWWGGAIHVTLPPSLVDGFLANIDIAVSDVELTLDPLLPPVVTSCTPSGNMQLQLGDLHTTVSLTLGDSPASAEVFLSVIVEVNPTTAPGLEEGTINIALEVLDLVRFDLEIVSAGGVFEGQEGLLDTLLGDVLVDMVMGQIGEGLVPSFPIPSIDIGGIVESIPEGTSIGFSPDALSRSGAYTVLMGGLSE